MRELFSYHLYFWGVKIARALEREHRHLIDSSTGLFVAL